MKRSSIICSLLLAAAAVRAQEVIPIERTMEPGRTKPIWVSVSGFTGEAARVLEFDLYVQGYNFTNAQNAQYSFSGSSNGELQGRVVDNYNKKTLVSKAYRGGTVVRQVHLFVDEFSQALQLKPIAQTLVAFKGEKGSTSEVYVSDFDGHEPHELTHDGSLVAAPCMVPGQMAVYYTSYKLNHPDIFHQNLATGARKIFARYGGSNMSPAASPDGARVAMILSKDGWTDLYVENADGSGLRRLTKSPQDESSPCWSPDSRWICYAAKDHERRALRKIPADGGESQAISTAGLPSPTEPDWAPDGKLIAFTAQFRSGFRICVVSPAGGDATELVDGEDPSWSPNSRTLAFARRQGGRYVLSLLDVPTKQVKDVARLSGLTSQSQPSWAR
ncbi:MAG TPA: hypothetical protein VG167_02100 [Verrucomicrobiae bacterium]|nr:hypothetical protein [Verrucomicrobiae bacterium]